MMKFFTPQMLECALKDEVPLQLIDVREHYEVDAGGIGGLHIPLDEVLDRKDELRRDIPVVFYCRSGKRASAIAHFLASGFQFNNLYILNGGLEAYVSEVNPEIEVY
jgi:adenylyltransferase/sulfurtransferase